MIRHVQEKPLIGIVAGIGTGIFSKIEYLLTDSKTLQTVSGLATWLGCAVALLTFVGWCIKIGRQIMNK